MDPLSFGLFFFLWSLGFLLLWRVDFAELPAEEEDQSAGAVSVIIPARNEAANLGDCLRSLQQQHRPPREVIVVDDHSTDDTARLAAAAGTTVVASAPLPDGWCGKPWACWQGAQRARGDTLLFLDADTRLEPDGLRRLTAAQTQTGGLVSVQPYHRMMAAYEQLAALFNLISLSSLGPFGLWRPLQSAAGAFGPCNICRRDEYFSAGGHQRAAGAVLESLPLAEAFSASGLPVRCLGGKGSVWFRMYPDGPLALVAGFGKGFATGAGHLSRLRLLLVTGWLIAAFEPLRHMLEEAVSGNLPGLAAWLACYLLFSGQLYVMLVQIGTFRWWTALAYPLPLLFFLYVFLYSLLMVHVAGRVRWKDRVIGP